MKRLILIVAVAACTGPQDDPSQVFDLRVIGASFSPPEVMAPSCQGLIGGIADGGSGGALAAFIAFAVPIELKWLVLDPNGGGRDITYELRACANPGDLECDDEGDWLPLTQGTMKPGELSYTVPLATTFLSGSLFDGGQPLLLEVINQDQFRGFGGIRVPVVLHVKAGDEEVFAQKLMVYNCRFFEDQLVNVQPVIPGVTVNGREWPESLDGGPTINLSLSGEREFEMAPIDFAPLEEEYVVPSFMLEPVRLKESWKFSWHASLGRFSSPTTGGTDFTGRVGEPESSWLPRIDGGTAGLFVTDVDFWFVVRDGRGGASWITRKAHFAP
ncbi:MAG: hypothetical protein JNK82_32500 [Myxococcaceae bacterium]|nr:hypothetical protein [Myxococcaceae bacterium]